MPRKVIESLVRELRRDVLANYPVGKRYRSLLEVCARFGISRVTAQRAVGLLVGEGLLTARPRAGITVVSHSPRIVVAGKRITVLSDLNHHQANQAVMRGVLDIAEPSGVQTSFLQNPRRDTHSLGYGDFVLGLDTDGVIAVSFGDAALGFYRAMREGLDLVADYDMPELPILPVIQTDFFKYGEQAGTAMVEQGHTDILVAGYPALSESTCYQERFEGFCSAVDTTKARVRYVCLSQPQAISEINSFFLAFTPGKAVFSIEFQANEILAAQFVHNRVPRSEMHYGVFVSCESEFTYPGLPPIRSFSPSLRELGRGLALRLIRKWETGTFGLPFVELM